jgi:DNA-binding winged helix-turn-helix (wHTH) protein
MLDEIDGWRIGECRLYRALRRVWLDGEIVPLKDIELRVLVILAEAGGDLVPKERFIDTLWHGRAVEESTLAKFVGSLRKKLGKNIIETHHGVGYSIRATIEPIVSVDAMRALYLTELFRRADDERQVTPDGEWDRRYKPYLDDVRTSLAWATARETADRHQLPDRRNVTIALAGATARLWERASAVAEGIRTITPLVELINETTPSSDAARLLRYAGTLSRESDRIRALSLFQRSAAIYRKLGDRAKVGAVLGLIGDAETQLGHLDRAEATLGEAEHLLNLTPDTKALWNVLNGLGVLATIRRTPALAHNYFMRAVDLAQLLQDDVRQGIVWLNWAELEFNIGAVDVAIDRCLKAEQALAHAPASYKGRPAVNLSTYYASAGEMLMALDWARRALELTRDEGGYWLRLCIQVWAKIAANDGRYSDAARLLGFVNKQYEIFGEYRQHPEQALHDSIMNTLRTNLGSYSINTWLGEGGRWREEQTIEFLSAYASR